MGKSWKVLNLCLGVLFCELCNGLPINLENTVADSHTQLLTGLVAVLLTVCSVVLLAGCLCCHRRNGFKEFRDSPVVASAASNLDHGHINPVANGEFTIFTPLSPPHQNNNVFLANQQIITRTQEDYVVGDVDVSSWFNGTETDFPRIKLKYIKEIGRGWFGRVVEGAAQDPEQKWKPVVVRILEATASNKERVVFLHDASIYRCGAHPNILKLFGRCLDTIPLLLLQEYCPQGDVKNYLRQNKSTADKFLSTEYPLIWCCQLSSALKHLHDNRLTHPDLAARNCQLTLNLTLKLGDYGLAVFQYPEDYYLGAPGVSVRWCAPESLSYTSTTIRPKKITMEANIWSFAVTIWEICECGEQPYSSLTDDEVISQVLGTPNVRLSRPKYQILYTDYIFRLMQLCWTTSESRPAMAQIDLMLAELLQIYKNMSSTQLESDFSVKDFDKRWESFKPNNIVKTDNHIVDSADIDLDDSHSQIVTSKPLSPSLNNLHGSLDNLLVDSSESQMESWLENVASTTRDMSFVRGLSDAIKDLDNAIARENSGSSDSSHRRSPTPQLFKSKPKIEFQLGPLTSKQNIPESPNQSDSLSGSFICVQRTSSGSETEEENWKKKIERGAYSEKVRQKSRSVADLMILTHIEPSESESETPLPSLDCRTNYKNVRYAPKQNLENLSLTFGSEGNLLNVQETFQEELRKLQEERRDSLLFVPENSSQINSSENLLSDGAGDDTVNSNTPCSVISCYLENSPSKRILQELNSTSDIKPVNQVFNVFNVTIDNFSPVRLKSSKLEELINFREEECIMKEKNGLVNKVPKLSDIVLSNLKLNNNFYHFNCQEKSLADDNSDILYDSGVEGDRIESTESLKKTPNEQEHKIDVTFINNFDALPAKITDTTSNMPVIQKEIGVAQSSFQVPKLVDLIQDNDDLMNYIIARYETESLGKMNESLDSLEASSNEDTTVLRQDDISLSKEFLDGEIKRYSDLEKLQVTFDLSESQEEAMPNSLTHSTILTSTPFRKSSLQELSQQDGFSSLNLFDSRDNEKVSENLYSLETWDNFLGRALDDQNESQEHELFDSFSSEPQSLLFTETEILINNTNECLEPQDRTYVCNEKKDATFVTDANVVDVNDINIELERNSKDQGPWDGSSGGGWFLHPQSNTEVSGEITVAPGTSTDSYVGFNVDDEIMAAIRTELLNKLPQAQGGSNGTLHDDEEWGSTERDEVFLRYNVYNTPLSPIPEESFIDDNSCINTPRQLNSEDESDDSDWTDQSEHEGLPPAVESHSAHTVESPAHPEPLHRHTPSQDSCCSNDTLFNLEELTCVSNDLEREDYSPTPRTSDCESQYVDEKSFVTVSHGVNNESEVRTEDSKVETEEVLFCKINDPSETLKENITEVIDKHSVTEFLRNEREHDCLKTGENLEESNSESTEHLLFFINKQIAPLPSPEDKPWKQLPASLLSYDKVISQNMLLPASESNDIVPESHESNQVEHLYDNIPEKCDVENVENFEQHEYNADVEKDEGTECYENVPNLEDFYNEADYVNIVNLENTKNSADFINKQNTKLIEEPSDCNSPDYVNSFSQNNDLIINNDNEERDIFGVLTDIRFSGPSDSQLMTTSFSESNDLNDEEQDWDSGSDTRSSSSGEFIWKEGEHEESLKALRAAPQDVLEDIQPMEDDIHEGTSSESSGSDEDGESPEFVPSAWDKYATPTKSALRSPEKSLEKTDKKKPKGVWFKKQKYHCVYEYPREPESPVLHSYDLWKPQTDYSAFNDWELDGTDAYVPSENSDDYELSQNYYRPKPNRNINMYQLSSITDFTSSESGMDDEFFISSSAKPFDMISGLTSQFFPGNWTDLAKTVENVTPDSGVEDITPGGSTESDFMPQVKSVPTLKQIASEVLNKNKKIEELRQNEELGGLRHTRNKLKLDLPPSPSAFTSNKMFSIEPIIDPVINREKPTFTTFGKSRFLVQHVDTPPDDEVSKSKNVSFEALPYKPLQTHIMKEDFEVCKNKGKVEIVRGEASLLDSADEDSGIESSTLERKYSHTV